MWFVLACITCLEHEHNPQCIRHVLPVLYNIDELKSMNVVLESKRVIYLCAHVSVQCEREQMNSAVFLDECVYSSAP